MTDSALLTLRGITAGYGSARGVLRGVDLTCAPGELLGVLGANGCGKSTLLRVASGALRPLAGTVTVEGDDVAELSPRAIARRVAVLPQESGPLFPMTVLDVVLLGRHPWQPAFAFEGEEDVAIARDALAQVDAAPLADRDVSTLSGGERQRVFLARALCQGGRVLLCDEPTSHLDLRHETSVFRLLRSVADDGRAVVVVTHDVNLAAQVCDRVLFLRPHGAEDSVVAAGPPAMTMTADVLLAAYGISVRIDHDPDGTPLVRRHI